MFDTINGLPAHVLMVHAAVVFVPLLALGAVVYAVWPRVRTRINWAVALLCVAAPASALFSMLSGNAFYERLAADGLPEQFLAQVDEHAGYGRLTFWAALALAAVAGALLLVTRRPVTPKAVSLVLSAAVIVLAVVAGYYVVMTGDSGATAVHGTV